LPSAFEREVTPYIVVFPYTSFIYSQRPKSLTLKPMLSTPNTTTSSFTAVFDVALAEYTKVTGKDLRDHPLAFRIDRCDSPDAILAIFQEQSRVFDEFRNGDPKLIKWLSPLVNELHAISTNEFISACAGLVSPLIALSY